MSERAAMLYARGGRALIVSESQTVDGFWIAAGPCLVEDLGSLDRVSRRVLDALDASRTGVLTPPPSAAVDSDLLEQAGVKSFGAFMKGARAVRIATEGHQLVVTPTRNGGPRRGFEFKESNVLYVDDQASLESALAVGLAAAE